MKFIIKFVIKIKLVNQGYFVSFLSNSQKWTAKYVDAKLFDNRQEAQAVIDSLLVMEEFECFMEEVNIP